MSHSKYPPGYPPKQVLCPRHQKSRSTQRNYTSSRKIRETPTLSVQSTHSKLCYIDEVLKLHEGLVIFEAKQKLLEARIAVEMQAKLFKARQDAITKKQELLSSHGVYLLDLAR